MLRAKEEGISNAETTQGCKSANTIKITKPTKIPLKWCKCSAVEVLWRHLGRVEWLRNIFLFVIISVNKYDKQKNTECIIPSLRSRMPQVFWL